MSEKININGYTYTDNETTDCNKKIKCFTGFAVVVVVIAGLACLWV